MQCVLSPTYLFVNFNEMFNFVHNFGFITVLLTFDAKHESLIKLFSLNNISTSFPNLQIHYQAQNMNDKKDSKLPIKSLK